MNSAELEAMSQQEREKQQKFRCRLLCCASTPCLSSGGAAVQATLAEGIKQRGLDAEVQTVSTGCMGPCSRGPVVTVQAPGQPDTVYEAMTPAIAEQLLEEHVVAGKVVADHALPAAMPFLAKQYKIVLANSGVIDPERIEDYLAHDGYRALDKVLREMTPEEACNAVVRSGLRGRGGADYPAGLKLN
ncbi:MAG TPA: NAD(P)H-dependent oxidoreductase subunit E, partial [Caldilineaceae bacterium]|nr:NAD(P)H-dependent oxidoreductase subunit E [Caldilineaceae bacterium]